MQQALSRKIYLELPAPTEADAGGDRERILELLPPKYGEVDMPLSVLRTLYPMCRDASYHLTVTLVFCGSGWEVLQVEPGDTTDRLYAAAVDYGSTTLVMQVVDLNTGEVLTEQSIFNGQIPYGEEILSRIFYTKDNPEHLKELQQVTTDSFNALIEKCEKACGIPKEQYTAMTVGGNTTMMHFLLGLYPWPIFETPYAPVAENPGFLRAGELGIHLPGYVYLFPAAANYLGGDIISGLTAAGIDESTSGRMGNWWREIPGFFLREQGRRDRHWKAVSAGMACGLIRERWTVSESWMEHCRSIRSGRPRRAVFAVPEL